MDEGVRAVTYEMWWSPWFIHNWNQNHCQLLLL